MAQPVGGSVVAGQAQIHAQDSLTTVITQSSTKAIINWQDFSVASGATVRFNQPGAGAITLNRVVGANSSVINGAIQANGQVWLLNPNGVLFGQGANINIGGLLATTGEIANNDFISGNFSFSGGTGSVVNKGRIHAASGGSVVLSAPRVANSGLIQANAGKVVLGGAEAFTVDFTGDHLLSYAVTTPVSHAAKDGGTARVTNSGTIRAAGGQVLLTARAASNIAAGVVNNSGMIEATSAHMENGEVVLDAGDGTAQDSGTLDASGKGAGETGGSVKVLGKTVAVADGAKIDVSGDSGGGQALIGGNLHGGGTEAHAQTTSVGKATITADAIRKGNGGKVVVWSDSHTQFAGTISARGGAKGGDGGQVETSGATLDVRDDAQVTTAASVGTAGTWLLDPQYIYIRDSGTDSATGQTFAFNASASTVISPTLIDRALGGGNVVLQANTDIEVDDALTITSTTANTLSLQAGRSIILDNSISYATGTVALSANDPGAIAAWRLSGTASINGSGSLDAANIDLVLHADGSGLESIGGVDTPVTVLGGNTYIATNGANAYISTSLPGVPAGGLALGNSGHSLAVDMGAGSLAITANGVTQSAPVSLNNLTLDTPSGTATGQPFVLDNTANAITGTVNADILGANSLVSQLEIFNAQTLTVGDISVNPDGNGNQGDIFLHAYAGDLLLNGTITTPGATLYAQNNITQAADGVMNITYAGTGSGGVALDAFDGAISMPGNNFIQASVVPTGTGSETAISALGELAFASGKDSNINLSSGVALYAANAGGAMNVTTTGSINLSDAAGNSVKHYNEIAIYNPVTASGFITLHAAGDIIQAVGPNTDVHIATPEGVLATSDNGAILLNDGGHAAESGTNCTTAPCPADAGNQVGGDINGYSVFNSAGNTSFTNTVDTIIGGHAYYPIDTSTGLPVTPTFPHTGTPMAPPTGYNSPDSTIGGNLDVEVTDANEASGHSVLVLAGRIHAQNSNGGYTTLHATGDLINNNGSGTIIAGTGAYNNLNLVSDFGAVGGFDGTAWTFGDGTDSGVLNIRAIAATSILINPGDINIGITGLAGGFQAPSVLIFGNGVITQNSDSSGVISTTGTFDAHAAGAVTLDNPLNAVQGAVSFTTTQPVLFHNSVQTTIDRASNGTDSSNNEISGGDVDIEVSDPTGATNPGIYIEGNGPTDSLYTTTGTITLHAAGDITESSNPVTAGTLILQSDTGVIGGVDTPILATAGTLAASTVNRDIFISAKPLDTDLVIGNGGIDAGTGNVSLSAVTANILGDYPIVANHLDIAGASMTLDDVEVQSLGARTSGGVLTITSSSALQIDSQSSEAGIDSQGGAVTLAASSITQASGDAGKILSGDLEVATVDSGGIFLNNDLNAATGTLQFYTGADNALFFNSVSTHLGTAAVTGTLTVHSDSDLEIESGAVLVSQAASGDGVVLGATGSFTNNSGSGAIYEAGGARFLIYSADSAGDTFGGLDSGNTAIWNTPYTSVFASGNRYVFAEQPTLSVTAGNLAKAYGVNNAAAVTADYAITGLQPGVSGAYLGDTAAAVYSGTPSVSSTGSAASAGVGSYAVTPSAGSLAVGDGYGVQYFSGSLTVNPATLSYVAGTAGRTYGAANPIFGGTVSGFVNGDTQSSATTGTLSFTSAATASSGVGHYAITGSGLSAQNYVFTQAAANATALTINPATLRYVATAASRTYGAANPALGGTVTGFVNGDTQSSATTGTLAFTAAAMVTSNVGHYAITGSGLSAGNYVFVQASGNGVALTINPAILTYTANSASRAYGAADPAFSGTLTGFVNGDTQASATTGTLAFSTPATVTSNVGQYAINGAGLSAQNYSFAQSAGNATAFTIDPAILTYVASGASRSYGAANPTLTGSLTGFLNGDTQASATTGTLAFSTTATTASDVGSYAVNGSGLGAVNYVFVNASANATALTINPAMVTIALTGTASKVYDGTTSAALAPENYAPLSGVLNGDAVTVNHPTAGTYDDSAVGTGKTVTVTGLALSGAKASDYVIVSSVSGAIGTITVAGAGIASDPVVISVASASQSSANQPSRPGTLYLDTGNAPPAPLSETPAPTQPVIASLTPSPPPGPMAELVLTSTAADSASSSDDALPSDAVTQIVVASLNGGRAPASTGYVIIPGLLRAAPGRHAGQGNTSDLSAWGNEALWQ